MDSINSLSDSRKLQTILELKFLSANKLSKLLGYKSPASVYHVVEGRNNLSTDMISRIIKKFPDVNYKYLREGKEEPLLKDTSRIQYQKTLFGLQSEEELEEAKQNKPFIINDNLSQENISNMSLSYQLNILIHINQKQTELLEKILKQLESN